MGLEVVNFAQSYLGDPSFLSDRRGNTIKCTIADVSEGSADPGFHSW